MFKELLKLYKKNANRVPLEDFTTEAFIGILNIEPQIKNDFIYNFLKLEKDEYFIKTQVFYDLSNDPNCIVDVVIEGDNHICFIENKVNSKAGYKQVERYSKLLEQIKTAEKVKTKFFYCSKFYEKQPIQFEEKSDEKNHYFEKRRWFQIASFLKKYSTNKTVQDFLSFLKQHGMSENLEVQDENLFAFQNMSKTIKLTKNYMNRLKPIFKKKFNKGEKVLDGVNISQIINHDRLIYYTGGSISTKGWSHIMYGFKLNEAKLFVQIIVSRGNKQHKEFKLAANKLDKNKYKIINHEERTSINLEQKIEGLAKNVSLEYEIIEWFKMSFDELKKFIDNTNQLDWKI